MSGVHPLVVGVLPGRRSRVRVTTSDPRWQRGDGGWWHWPEGATEWQWIPDPPPTPNPDQIAEMQARRIAHYDAAIREFDGVARMNGFIVKAWLAVIVAVVVFYIYAQAVGPY